ncbi:MAG: transcription termination factor NusA [Deltaproteobacteria bacterium]|nr:transcription termination factor NusA [Deltaproteobacteria bacterium]
MVSDLNQVIETVVKERGVSRDVIVEALEAAMLTAARKKLGIDYDIEAHFNSDLGEVELFRFREVVEDVEDENVEIEVGKAKELDPEVAIGDSLGEKIDAKGFGRISAQMAKQVIIQKVRDAEKDNIFNEYKDRKGEIANGILRRFEKGAMIVDLGRAEGIMYPKDQIPRESYNIGDRVRAFIQDIVRSTVSPQIILSRTSADFLRKLFELEVPEIAEGIVSIVSAAREPGMRAKIAVSSRDPNVDPVGACVGMKGSRVQSVVNELRGEKIDIVPYSENPARFVCNALAPAEVTKVIIDEDSRAMQIIVADDQLSLAIGKRGQNVRLAVQLSGWKLDIQSETKWNEISEIAKSVFARVPQIPEVAVDLLIKSGYMDVEELADAKPEDLMRYPGIDEARAKEIIEICNRILDFNDWPLPEPEPAKAAEGDAEEGADGASEAKAPGALAKGKGAADGGVSPEMLFDLLKLDGVGLESARALYRAGYKNREALKNVTIDVLLAVPGLDVDVAQRVAEAAKPKG